ncbi:MAG TPA: hypothetical protein VGN42_24035, partial [Pirellulales bacterium]|nr:hypothetical protein [Pirellulales bacterium]
MRTTIVLAVVFLSALVLLSAVTMLPGETAVRLLFGWLSFIARAAGRLAVNGSGVATALICLLLLLLGGNYFLKGLAAASAVRCAGAREAVSHVGNPAPMPENGRWPLRRTALLLAAVVLMFVTGIAFIGLVHQTAWLATAPEPLTRYRLQLGHRGSSLKYPRTQFMTIGMGYLNYVDVFKKSPANGPAPTLHEGSHSWQTRLLGFMPTSRDNIDFQKDWDDPKNAPAFRRFVPYFLNPDIGVLRERRGFAVS